MPYFVKIGANPTNYSGVGSRGYQIYRRARRVNRTWGSVEVRPGRHFVWIYTQQKVHNCSSERAAVALVRKLVDEREAAGYSRLPPGRRIDQG